MHKVSYQGCETTYIDEDGYLGRIFVDKNTRPYIYIATDYGGIDKEFRSYKGAVVWVLRRRIKYMVIY